LRPEHAPLRLRLPIPFPIGHVNAYLLRGDPLTLVDCGPHWPATLAALEAGLAAEGLRVEDIELLVLTHQHEDHAGLAGALRELTGCEVAAQADVGALLRDEPASRAREDGYETALMRLHGTPEDVLVTVDEASQDAREFSRSVVVDRPLGPGDELIAGSRRLAVHVRPGHSPTDTLLVDEDMTAIMGDHLLAGGPVATVSHRPPTGPADPRTRTSALLAYRASLRETAQLGLRTGLPGHGETVEDPASAIRDRLALHERRADSVLRRLQAGPRTAWALVDEIWGGASVTRSDRAMSVAFIVLGDLLGSLDLLVEQGRAGFREEAGVLMFSAAGA
jgi:glyoxylase-like metal-dependent hydrolase (beta-lactamase superfamily II)